MTRPPFNRESALEAAERALTAWNARDPADFIRLLSDEPIWKDQDQVIVGRREIWESLQQKWSRALHLAVDHTLRSHDADAITLAFEAEWQDSTRGQWFRTSGESRLQFDANGLISSFDTRGHDEPITAGDRRLSLRPSARGAN